VEVAIQQDAVGQWPQERSAWQQLLVALRHSPQLEVQQDAMEIELERLKRSQ
jgi:hypothetical protein